MKKLTKMFAALCLLLLAACSGITEEGFSGSKVFVKDYNERVPMLDRNGTFAVFDGELSVEQRQALQFLYAYMPLGDMLNHGPRRLLGTVPLDECRLCPQGACRDAVGCNCTR